MKLDTKAVHAGDRKKSGSWIPVTTPIHTAASFFYDSMEQLDRVFALEEEGPCYSRYDNPTRTALEELITSLENGHGAIATASGMSAVHLALVSALLDRPKRIVAARALYGASLNVLNKVLAPLGVETTFVDICDFAEVEQAITGAKPGCVLMETISNPLLRVGPMDRIAAAANKAGAPLIVDNTFATPVLLRPLELGAGFVVHSTTKYLAGHGDVLGGAVVTTAEHYPALRTLARTIGPVAGPFDAYLAMRGIKTLALRVERQCSNACRVAAWLKEHPKVERVHFPATPDHPDAANIRRLLPDGRFGAMVSFSLKDAGRPGVFTFFERLKMIVRATSLGDVHTMALYPAMSSHRDLSPKERERLGIGDNLVRLSIGIEAAEDILDDLGQALG